MFSNSIYDILSSIKPNNPFYIKRYVKFISTIQESEEGEEHHILPKSLFPEYSDFKLYPENKKKLSYKAHYIAHLILWKALGGKMAHAFQMMTVGRTIKVKNSNLYNNLRLELKELRSCRMNKSNPWTEQKIKEKIKETYGGMGNASPVIREKQKKTLQEKYGVSNSFQIPDVILKLKQLTVERNKDPIYKKLQSERVKKSLENVDRTKENNSFFGKTHSEESRKKISDAKKRRKAPRYCCIICSKELGINNLTKHTKVCKI
jgi:hypothetical protein